MKGGIASYLGEILNYMSENDVFCVTCSNRKAGVDNAPNLDMWNDEKWGNFFYLSTWSRNCNDLMDGGGC